jgi:siroheme synthase
MNASLVREKLIQLVPIVPLQMHKHRFEKRYCQTTLEYLMTNSAVAVVEHAAYPQQRFTVLAVNTVNVEGHARLSCNIDTEVFSITRQ